MRLIVLLFAVMTGFFTTAQKYTFVTYSTEEGLPQSQVTAFEQDSLGYLWVGTLGGLARFNGEEFVTYSTKDGMVNNRVTALKLINGTMFVGHDGGVSTILNDSVSSFFFPGSFKSNNVSDIISFKGEVYVCSNGGGLFLLKNGKLTSIDLIDEDSKRIRAAFVSDDRLYLATRAGILFTNDGKRFNKDKRFPSYSYSDIAHRSGLVYFMTFTEGLLTWNMNNNRIQSVDSDLFPYSVFGGLADKGGTLWMNTLYGVLSYDHKSRTVSLINNASGLPVDMISCVFEDRDGNLWIGSQGKGMFRFSGSMFTYFDKEEGFPSDLYVSGFQRGNGDIVLGTYDAGIAVLNKDGSIRSLDPGEGTIWAGIGDVYEADWFGAQSALLKLTRDGEFKKFFEEDGAPGTKMTALYYSPDGRLFIGGNAGVAYMRSDGNIRLFDREGSLDIGTVRDFEFWRSSMYCATNLGVYKLSNNKITPVLNDRKVVYNLERDDNGQMWYGTEEGLFRMTPDTTVRIDLLSDPGSNFINFLNYRNGRMYVGTNNGLFVLSELSSEKPSFKRYGIGEGIVDLETNLNSGFFDQEGHFWFGTAKGLVKFNTKRTLEDFSAPVITLSNVLLNFEEFDFSEFSTGINTQGLPVDLNLPYFKNNLIFEFDAVSLTNHRGMRFQFKLEGENDVWSPLTPVPTITFNSLNAGEYKLLVRAVDQDGRISNTVVFPFVIRQAFYKTWWFISLMVLLVLIIVYSVFRIRLKRLREANEREKLEYKTRLLALEQKSVNASMNRHFIFNALNSIQYFINTQDRKSANRYLTNFAQLIRKNLDSANSNANTISLEEELDRIKLYLGLEAMRFQGRFDYEVNVGDDIDLETIKIPAMIMQPFVENSIIHGILPNEDVHGLISINVKRKGNMLLISIEDNGIGVNRSLLQKDDMDGDHRSQGMEITSKRIELIRKISKNDISLEGPEEIKDVNGSIKGTYVLIKIPLDDLDI